MSVILPTTGREREREKDEKKKKEKKGERVKAKNILELLF